MTIRYGYSTRNASLGLDTFLFFEKPIKKDNGPGFMETVSHSEPFTSVEDVKEYLDSISGQGFWQFDYKIITEENYVPKRHYPGYVRPEPRPGGYITDIGTPPESPIEEA